MKIPKKIKIGGHVYKVLYPHRFIELSNAYGQCDNPRKIIRISDVDAAGLPRAESGVMVTLLHEILHAIDYSLGIPFDFASNERNLVGLSEMLFQVFKDNDLDFRKRG